MNLQQKAVKLEELLKKEINLDCTVTIESRESLLIRYKDLSIKQLAFINSLDGQFNGTFIYYICRNFENGTYTTPDYDDVYEGDITGSED